MFSKKIITRIAIVATLALAALGATATAALADSGAGTFSNDGLTYATTAQCNLATHRATFSVMVRTPSAQLNGVWFSDIVYARDVSANGQWAPQGQVTQLFNTQHVSSLGVSYSQPAAFSNLNFQGIAGHYYEFRVYYNWAPPGGYWQGWQYFQVAPFTWLTSYGPISGYAYCRL